MPGDEEQILVRGGRVGYGRQTMSATTATRSWVIACLIAIGYASAPAAQDRADLSGRWTMMGDATAARGLFGVLVGLCGIECEISAGASAIAIKRQRPYRVQMPEVLTIDWEQRREFPRMGAAPASGLSWTSHWSGGELVITAIETSSVPSGQARFETRHTLSRDGAHLKIVTERRAAGETPTRVDVIYSKRPTN